ncbi:MAG: protein kinase domain-containing protein [Vicinamibacterales bacterium]
MALPRGTRLGPYVIDSALGAGGMGEVYRATDTRLDRVVAIKILRSEIARDLGSRERFEHEARAISCLNHPHICTLHDVGRERVSPDGDDIDFLVMELVEGEPLGQLVARGPLPAAHVVRHGLDIAAALEEAHDHDVVHGDLKPGNIMVTRFGLKLLDFGLARQRAVVSVSEVTRMPTHAMSGVVAGTVPYMAPEVLRGAPADARSDLWAMGVVLHEMATGVRPFTGQTGFELSAAILDQAPAPAPVWVPVGLQTIIGRCLAKPVADRYQRAAEVRAALEAVQSDPTIAPPAPATAHNLPLQLTRFIGREREIAELKPLLASERLVTVTGAGGSGKTRLALQVVQDVAKDFQHGVWLIELAPLGDPDLIPHTIASTLGMRPESGQSVTDALIDFLRPRRTLLLLDNCEHVITACAALVSQILRACPRVSIVATSREALAVAGERAWRVPSLTLPDVKAGASADVAAKSDAVRFFVDRAQAVEPRFALSPESAPAVARICHRLDGIPLALELAASRLKVLSLEQIGTRLDDRFQLLTGGSRTAVPRQQTLRATIDWSYDLLSEAERRLLRRLSVFAGGCSLEAAEQVCGSDDGPGDLDTIELLSHLIDKSLVAVEDDEAVGRRYRLLETVRQYARDRLFESGEAARVRDGHFQFFQRLALEAEAELLGPRHVAWARRLAADHDNLRVALEWGLTRSGNSDMPLRMVCALWIFWNQRNHFAECRQWVERVLAVIPDAPRSLHARALAGAADCAFLSGDYSAAAAFSRGALALDDPELGRDRWAVAFATFILGNVAVHLGDTATGGTLIEQSAFIARAAGAAHITGLLLIGPMFTARLAGDYQRARGFIDESVALLRPLGKWMLATALANLCDIALCQARPDQAEDAGREGVASAHETADTRALTWCLAGLARTAGARQQPKRAARLWGAAEGLSESIGAPLPSFIRDTAEADLLGVRQALGDERFAAAWTEGRQMTADAVVAYALQDDESE